jgi:hypothetical protein
MPGRRGLWLIAQEGDDPAHEQNEQRGTECNHPVAERPMRKADEKIPEQRHRTGVGVRPVRVRAENPIPDEPDSQGHSHESDEKRETEDDQLTGQSGPVGE